jgi:hypothetical protein
MFQTRAGADLQVLPDKPGTYQVAEKFEDGGVRELQRPLPGRQLTSPYGPCCSHLLRSCLTKFQPELAAKLVRGTRALLVRIQVDAKAGMLEDKILKRALLVVLKLDVGVVHVCARPVGLRQNLPSAIRTEIS